MMRLARRQLMLRAELIRRLKSTRAWHPWTSAERVRKEAALIGTTSKATNTTQRAGSDFTCLLSQADLFEGLPPVGEDPDAPDLAACQVVDVRCLHPDRDSAGPAAR